jgi:hypothetical protein
MGSFFDPLFLEYGDGFKWKLTKAFTYRDDTGWFVVPEGFETDFASVPRFFWRLFPPTGKYGKAAVVHDFLYRTGKLTRRECDAVFYNAMKSLGVRFFTRWSMWGAVRLFGWAAYEG